jgi:hypothetical protein
VILSEYLQNMTVCSLSVLPTPLNTTLVIGQFVEPRSKFCVVMATLRLLKTLLIDYVMFAHYKKYIHGCNE